MTGSAEDRRGDSPVAVVERVYQRGPAPDRRQGDGSERHCRRDHSGAGLARGTRSNKAGRRAAGPTGRPSRRRQMKDSDQYRDRSDQQARARGTPAPQRRRAVLGDRPAIQILIAWQPCILVDREIERLGSADLENMGSMSIGQVDDSFRVLVLPGKLLQRAARAVVSGGLIRCPEWRDAALNLCRKDSPKLEPTTSSRVQGRFCSSVSRASRSVVKKI